MFNYYKRSGKIGILPILLAPAFALPTIFAAGWLYDYLTNWVSSVYFNFFLTIAYAWAVGAALWLAFRMGHCRNRGFAMICGIAAGAAAFGVSLWEQYPTRELLEQRFETGWEVNFRRNANTAVHAPAVVVWPAELITLIGFAAGAAVVGMNNFYCETCHRWVKGKDDTLLLKTEKRFEDDPLKFAVPKGDMDKLFAAINRGRSQGTLQLIVGVKRCSLCQGTAYLTIQCKSEKNGKYGKEAQTKTLVDQIEVSDEEIETLKSMF